MLDSLNIAPEITLLFIALAALVLSLFKISPDALSRSINILILGLIAWLFANFFQYQTLVFESSFNCFVKIILLGFCIITNMLFATYTQKLELEYFAFVLFSCLGGFVIVSARDFLTLFMGVELQSLASYILSSMLRSPASSEAGVKYFSLGAISTCLMLFGISFVYGASGSIEYASLLQITSFDALTKFAILLIISSFLFKLASAPFHVWLPDVYQGSPFAGLSVFISVNKLSSLAGLISLFVILRESDALLEVMTPLFLVSIILSLLIGAFGALKQTNFKRFVAYSSIFDAGFLLLFFVISKGAFCYWSVFYLLIYTLSILLIFSALARCKLNIEDLEINGLTGLFSANKTASIILGTCLFSLMGIPPLLGFAGKFSILFLAISDGHYYLAIFASAMTLVSSYYYLRIIKTIFLSPISKDSKRPFVSNSAFSLQLFNVLGAAVLGLWWVFCFINL